jgi:membrane-bound ClpP family serine protease
MIGQTAVVVDPIRGSVHPGHVFISGERWLAVSGDGTMIETGQKVVIVEIRQTTLVVAPV